MCAFIRVVLVLAFVGGSFRAYAGADAAKLDSYFDSLMREPTEGFESWYPKKKEAPDNPRALSFDPSAALGGHWSNGTAFAALASYITRTPYAQLTGPLESPSAILGWLRNVSSISQSDLIEATPATPKIRMTMSVPLLFDLNGFYEFSHATLSDQRTILRWRQINEEGPASDSQYMIFIDRQPDQTAFLHLVSVLILKPEQKTGLLTSFWMKYRHRKICLDLIQQFTNIKKVGE